jgi:hypothetical protein
MYKLLGNAKEGIMRSERTKKLLWKADAVVWETISKKEAEGYPPERIFSYDGYTYLLEDNTDEEIKITLLAQQTLYLRTIRNIIIFFFIIWLIGAAVGISYILKIASVLY